MLDVFVSMVCSAFKVLPSPSHEGEGLQVIRATKGEDAVLPCTLRTPRSQQSWFRVRWMKQTVGSSTFSVVPDSERVGKALNFNGDLTLKAADEPQEGDYICQVCEGFSCDLTTNLTLKLRGKTIHRRQTKFAYSNMIILEYE